MGKNTRQPWRRALRAAREARGWSFLEASKRTGIGRQQLKNLEGHADSTRPTKPEDIRLGTALRLIEAYYPDVLLEDLVPGTPCAVTAHKP